MREKGFYSEASLNRGEPETWVSVVAQALVPKADFLDIVWDLLAGHQMFSQNFLESLQAGLEGDRGHGM